jgi:hypothetical protein
VLGAAFAILWFAIDWTVLSRGLGIIVRATGCGACLLAAAFVGWIAFRPAPLDVLIALAPANYPSGTNVFGVAWRPEFFPLNIAISNETDREYDGFDSYLRTDIAIAHIGVRPSINQCVATVENPYGSINGAALVTGNVAIPLFDNERASSTFYRLRCDKIAANSRIEFVVAAILGAPVASPSTKPKWAALSARYTVNRERRAFVSQCFVDSCPDIPASFGVGW